MRKDHGIIMPPFMSPPQIHLNISMKWEIFTHLGNDMMPPQGIPHIASLNIKLTVASVTCHNHPPSVFSKSVCFFNFLAPIYQSVSHVNF